MCDKKVETHLSNTFQRVLSIIGLVVTKLDFDAYEQQRCRPACASMQSDQRISYSLSGELQYG